MMFGDQWSLLHLSVIFGGPLLYSFVTFFLYLILLRAFQKKAAPDAPAPGGGSKWYSLPAKYAEYIKLFALVYVGAVLLILAVARSFHVFFIPPFTAALLASLVTAIHFGREEERVPTDEDRWQLITSGIAVAITVTILLNLYWFGDILFGSFHRAFGSRNYGVSLRLLFPVERFAIDAVTIAGVYFVLTNKFVAGKIFLHPNP